MIDNDDELFDAGYRAGAQDARAGMAGDIRALVDHFHHEIRELRREVCCLAGLPPPPPLDMNGHELQ